MFRSNKTDDRVEVTEAFPSRWWEQTLAGRGGRATPVVASGETLVHCQG